MENNILHLRTETRGNYRNIIVRNTSTHEEFYGVEDLSGNLILPPIYSAAYIQGNHYVACFTGDEPEPVYYDLRSGENLCKKYKVARIREISQEDQLLVEDSDGREGIIDYEGNYLIPLGKYDELGPIGNHLVCRKDGKFGLSLWSGEEILECVYDEVYPDIRSRTNSSYSIFQSEFHDIEHIPVRIKYKKLYVGKSGQTLDVNANFIGPFGDNGYAIVGLGNDRYSDTVIDTEGNIVFQMPGCLLDWMDGEHLFFQKNGNDDKVGIVSLSGQIILAPICQVSPFGPGLIIIDGLSSSDNPSLSSIFKIANGKLVQLTPFSNHPFGYADFIYVHNSRGKYDSYNLDGKLVQEDACDELIHYSEISYKSAMEEYWQHTGTGDKGEEYYSPVGITLTLNHFQALINKYGLDTHFIFLYCSDEDLQDSISVENWNGYWEITMFGDGL